jgi:cell division protein FtsQ
LPATLLVMNAALATPTDVRLMNAVAAVLFVIAIGSLLATGLAALSRAPWFAFHSVRIEGDVQRNSAATIRVNALPRLVGDFFRLDLDAARSAFESVPWVRRASVSRIWPDQLVVRLEEHRVAALWESGDSSERLVNSHGEVFDANLGDVEDERLPKLEGPQGRSAQMLAMHARLSQAFEPLGRRIDHLELSGRGSWRVRLNDGARIELGRGSDDELVQRAERFVHTVPQLLERYERPLLSADLRHRDGYALRLKGVVTLLDIPPTGARGAAAGARTIERR